MERLGGGGGGCRGRKIESKREIGKERMTKAGKGGGMEKKRQGEKERKCKKSFVCGRGRSYVC